MYLALVASTWICKMMNWALIAVVTEKWDLIWNMLVHLVFEFERI